MSMVRCDRVFDSDFDCFLADQSWDVVMCEACRGEREVLPAIETYLDATRGA